MYMHHVLFSIFSICWFESEIYVFGYHTADVLFSIRVMLLRNGEAPKVKAPVLPMQRITLGN
jgi:hypothetical protein